MRARSVAANPGRRMTAVSCFLSSVLLVLVDASGQAAATVPAGVGGDRGAGAQQRLRVPVTFEQNFGQAARSVRFLARGDGFDLLLGDAEPRLTLHVPGDTPATFTLGLARTGGSRPPEGLDVVPAVSNYYLGNDPSRWVEGARHFERVLYREVYPGIDVVFHARGRELELDFEIAPGAEPDAIGIVVEGAGRPRIDTDGNVEIEAGGRSLMLRAPVTYQQDGAVRRYVDSSFRIDPSGMIRFAVAGYYDRMRPLVIDPVLSYVSYLGGTLGERIGDLTVDSGGNVYVTGYTFSADFPASPGAAKSGGSDIFVARLNAAGNALIFSTFLGGAAGENDGRVSVDAAGNVYVSGLTGSDDFPVVNAAQPTRAGSLDFTVTKLGPSGNIVYSTYVGGSSLEIFADGMAVDAEGAAYLCGQTVSADYPTTNAAWDETCGTNGACNGTFDGVVTKISPGGDSFDYSTYVGGSAIDFTIDVDVDAAGSAYVVGMTTSADLPTTAGAVQPAYNGDSGDPAFDGGDAFLVKLTPAGDTASYATYVGGSDDDGAFGVAVDGAGAAYVVGATTSTDFPATAGAFQTSFAGGVGGGSLGIPGHFVGGDGFVAKLAPAGDAYEYATYVGGSANDKMNRVALRGTSAYVSGETRSADLPTVDALQPTHGGGDFDAYAFRLSSSGDELLAATYIGGSDDVLATAIEFAAGIDVDTDGNAYVGGGTSATDLPATPGALQESFGGASAGLGDGWVAKIAMGSNPTGAPPDHYLCYKARGRPRLESIVSLPIADVFESTTYEVKKRSLLCNPADREAQGVAFLDVHALGYRISRSVGGSKHLKRTGVEVTDQFGTFLYDTKKELALLVPTAVDESSPVGPLDPSSHSVDSYKCYRVRASRGAPRIGKGVEVVMDGVLDDAASFEIRKPSSLCLAADVGAVDARKPNGHLMCYAVKRTAGAYVRRAGLHAGNEIEQANPEGPAVLDTIKDSELCVPAVVGPAPVPICGDDVINQPSEQCDGDDDLACPGILCQGDCTCAAAGVCGNGLAEPPVEQCDGADDSACPGECTSLCACLGARTFTLDPTLSEAQTSLGVNVPLSGAVNFVFTQEIAPGVLVFDIPITQLPGVDLGGVLGTICPFLVQDPSLPAGFAGRGVLNCSAADLMGTGFLESPDLSVFQDHCVEGAAAGFCDSAPNAGGGIVHAVSGVLVPDGTVDPTCAAPGNVVDDNATHGGGCNGAALLGVGANPYAAGDATVALNVVLDRRASGVPCDPPPTPGSEAVNISFTTGSGQGGIMDLNANSASVFAFALDGAAFDCTAFLLGNDPTGAAIVGVFTALDTPLLPGLELDIVSSIRFTGQEP